MEDKVGLTLACLNIKKIGKNDGRKDLVFYLNTPILFDYGRIKREYKKTNIIFDVCLYSDISEIAEMFLFVSLCIRV